MHKNKSTIYQNLWDSVKIVLGEKIITLNVYIMKEEKLIIDNHSLKQKNE